MKWMEQIRLRAPVSEGSALACRVSCMVEDVRRTPGILSVELYRYASLETDLLIHIQWDTVTEHPWGSPVAVGLAHTLRHFGLVDHSVWVGHDQGSQAQGGTHTGKERNAKIAYDGMPLNGAKKSGG